MGSTRNGNDGGNDDEAPPTTPRRHDALEVNLGALRQVHGAVLEVEGLVNAAVRHASQAERQADRAHKLQIDHGHALDRLAKAYGEVNANIAALGKAVEAQATHVEGTFAGLDSYLRGAGVGQLPELAADVKAIRAAVGRLPDDAKKNDEGEGLLGWMGTSRRRYAVITAVAAVVGAGAGGALAEIARRLLGGH